MNNCNNHKRGKRKRSDESFLTTVLRDFIRNTSIHGIKYLDGSRKTNRVAKLFWIAILILAFIGSSLMLKLFWDRYQAHPVVSVIENFQTSYFRTDFPAVTVCSMIGPDPELSSQQLKKIKLPGNVTRKQASSLFRQAFEMAHVRAYMFEDRDRLDKLLKNNDIAIVDFLSGLRTPCSDIVDSCWWENEKISCSKFFKRSFTFGGHCCSFNYRLEDTSNLPLKSKRQATLKATNYGANSALTLVFKADQFIVNDDNGNIERITSTTIGLLVFLHHSLSYPDSHSGFVQAGREVQLRVSPIENHKVSGIVGENDELCYQKDFKIKYFDEYARGNCYNSCRIRAALALCQCVPWHFAPFVDNEMICNFSEMKCLRMKYQEIWSVMFRKDPIIHCFCPSRCDSRFYEFSSTEIPLAPEIINPSSIYSNLSMDNAVLKVYLGEQVYVEEANFKSADEIYLLCKFVCFGGTCTKRPSVVSSVSSSAVVFSAYARSFISSIF